MMKRGNESLAEWRVRVKPTEFEALELSDLFNMKNCVPIEGKNCLVEAIKFTREQNDDLDRQAEFMESLIREVKREHK